MAAIPDLTIAYNFQLILVYQDLSQLQVILIKKILIAERPLNLLCFTPLRYV